MRNEDLLAQEQSFQEEENMIAYQNETDADKIQATQVNGILEMFSTSRAGIDLLSDQVIESVQGGRINPLKVRVWCKSMEMLIERIHKETSKNQLTEAEKFTGTKFSFSGAEITKGIIKTEYDYSACGDVVYNRLIELKENLDSQIKNRQAFLKTVQQPQTLIDDATAEVYTCLSVKKTEIEGLKVSIK